MNGKQLKALPFTPIKMEQTKSIRIWQLLTLLLVICNIGILATIWIHPGRPPMPPRPRSPRDFLLETLQPGGDQTREIDALISEHRNKMEDLNFKGHQLKRNYFQTIAQPATTQRLRDSLLHEILQNQQLIESSTYDHLSKVRALCSDAQKKRFDLALPEMLKQMRRPGGEDREHHPDGPVGMEPPHGGPGAPPPPPGQ